MIELGNDMILLANLLALLVLAALVIYAVIGSKGLAKIVISTLLVIIVFLHYIILARIASLAEISFLPLFIVESTKNGSVLYPDIGQISILLLVLTWRKDIASFVNKMRSRREMTSIEEQKPSS